MFGWPKRSFRRWRAKEEAQTEMLALRADDPQAFDQALARLQSDDPTTRVFATKALVRVDPQRAASVLPTLVTDAESRVRTVAVDGLLEVSGRDAWPVFVQTLQDRDLTVARSAWAAIHKLSGPGDIAEILQLADGAPPTLARSMRIRARYLDAPTRQR